jgi:integrase
MTQYWFVSRPKTVEHQHPFLVFNASDQLHIPLTIFAKEACVRVDPKTVQTYLYSILPFFSWLDTDIWQERANNTWDASPQQVRRAVDDYLVSKLPCKVQPHHQGWKYITITAGTRSTLRVFLAALKMFYQVMRERGFYPFANPLVDSMSTTIAAVQAHLAHEEEGQTYPQMPEKSGVAEQKKRPKHRLTDSYYKLEHEEWYPQIIDDPKLPGIVLEGGKQLSLKYTRKRNECVTWLLFDTGARISEVTGLMLDDWAILGTHTKARAFNKGSFGKRTKTLSFHEDTVVLLKRYFNEERIRFDSTGYTLDDYLLLAKQKQVDLSTIPLFLTAQGTQLTPKEYREHYWNPACQAAGIEADIHQVRHWHVTLEVRDIYETAKNTAEIERRLRGLIEYMKWKSEETLASYQHYFEEQLDADTRERFHQHIHQEIQAYLEERHRGKRKKQVLPKKSAETSSSVQAGVQFDNEPDLSFLYSLAGEI